MTQQRIFDRTVDTLAFLYREGKTLEQIGYFFGVSRERIRQLLDGRVSSNNGGAHTRGISAKEKRTALSRRKREERYEKLFGCPYEQVAEINLSQWKHTHRYNGSRASAYYQQKVNARARAIPWLLTFPEWWAIWESSGKWFQRGRGKYDYCMSRKGDTGPYSVDNVIVQSVLTNSSDGGLKSAANSGNYRDELNLTPRQRQVHDLTVQGFGPSDIGKKLGIAASCVSTMKVNIKAHLRQMVAA